MSKTRKKTSVKKVATRAKKSVSRTKKAVSRKVKAATRKSPAKKTRKAAKPRKAKAVKRVSVSVPKSGRSALDHVSNSALKLVDEAASLLRSGIRSSTNQTEKARQESKKRALSLVNQAAGHLNKALDQGASGFRSILGRL